MSSSDCVHGFDAQEQARRRSVDASSVSVVAPGSPTCAAPSRRVHVAGSPGFPAWIANLAGNLQGAAANLVARKLATRAEIDDAFAELASFAARDDASTTFAWNRVEARQG